MLFPLIIVVVCFIFLTKGADIFVDAASKIARKFGLSPLFIGATVMAFGTSAPELFVSVQAVLVGSTALAVGNVVGSNIANIGLCLGVSGLLATIIFTGKVLSKKLYILLSLYAIFYAFAFDLLINRFEAILLLLLLVVFIYYMLQHKNMLQTDVHIDVENESVIKLCSLFVFGLLLILFFSNTLVANAILLARLFNVSESVIGMSIVAFGTSLPELVTSVVAILKGEHDISVGNIVGSNIFNIAMIIGVVGMIDDIVISHITLFQYLPIMLCFGLLLLPALYFKKINKYYAITLLFSYFGYIWWMF